MKLCILGNVRFIGRVLAETAVKHGHDVSIIHTGKYAASVSGAKYLTAEREDPDRVGEYVRAAKADVLIDAMAMTADGAEQALGAFRSSHLSLVVLSSQDVYAQFGSLLGHPAPPPEPLVNEESPLTIPYPFRGVAKHTGGEMYDKKEVERAFAQAVDDFPAITVLRLPAVYGRYDNKRRFGWFVDAVDNGRTGFPMQGGQWRCAHEHVDNVAAAILAACRTQFSGFNSFNVSEVATPTMRQRLERIALVMGAEVSFQPTKEELPKEFAQLGEMPNDFVTDSSRLRAATDYCDLKEPQACVEDLVDWLRVSRREAGRQVE